MDGTESTICKYKYIYIYITESHIGDKQTYTIIPTGNLESPINLTFIFFDCGRKLEYQEKNPLMLRENMQTLHRKAQD